MSWNSTSPDGTISVRANRAPMRQNTTYIETQLGKDHFWDNTDDNTLDGRHRFVQMPANDNGATPAIATDPAFATANIDAVLYAKLKTEIQAVTEQSVELFLRSRTDTTDHIMQLLGIRAMGCFNTVIGPGDTSTVTMRYSHGLAVDPALPAAPISIIPGAIRGDFTVTFLNDMPSEDYFVLGNCLESRDVTANSHYGNLSVKQSTIAANTTKLVGSMIIQTSVSPKAALPENIWPRQAWFIVFGG